MAFSSEELFEARKASAVVIFQAAGIRRMAVRE